MVDMEYPHRMSDKQKKALLKAFEAATPKFNKGFGKVLFFGTCGEIPGFTKDDLFHSPKK